MALSPSSSSQTPTEVEQLEMAMQAFGRAAQGGYAGSADGTPTTSRTPSPPAVRSRNNSSFSGKDGLSAGTRMPLARSDACADGFADLANGELGVKFGPMAALP
eukprot:CAMPEP_0198589896 /NCGR_PEP_ID=MMETSP1462-20131121/134985_1 /TAXON_ID=1333877 /ORGANISM="Brandtodinium nutriculum, Strain RCC3387" /LENGTH=103 /DNA_ID=CAMNT_0044321423 /DNA_START=29 /DNA_END=336 /DNA_ORIENTATION=+